MGTSLLHLETTVPGHASSHARALASGLYRVLRSAFDLAVDEPDPNGTFPLTAQDGDRHDLQASCQTALVAPETCHVLLHWHRVGGEGDLPEFPEFDGVLTAEPRGDQATRLHITGQLRWPPRLEQDRAEAQARDTAHRLLHGVKAELQRATADERRAGASMPARYRVKDLMSPPTLTLREDLPLRVAVLLLLEREVGAAPVVDDRDRVVGVLSASDLLAREAAPRSRRGIAAREEERRRLADRVGEACSRPAVTTSPEATVRNAARELLDRDLSLLVVTDEEGGPLGTLTRHDVLRALTRTAEELQAMVDQVVTAIHAEGDLHAEVSGFGHVSVHGTVPLRSTVDRVVGAIAAIDAVSDARADEVEWRHDDTGAIP